MRRIHAWIIVAAVVWTGPNAAGAASGPAPFVRFDEFLKQVSAASFAGSAIQKDAGVKRAESFEAMRRHILSMYEGVRVAHSFALDEQVFDCVPILQQPSARRLGLEQVALAPPAPEEKVRADGEVQGLASPLTLGLVDPFGNAVSCEVGTIPMRRITLEEMSRFETLETFFRKIPWGDDGLPRKDDEPVPVHLYAYGKQAVKNYGGSSWLNLWHPAIDGDASQIFSLSQHWYDAGSGDTRQTVEGGWQAFPFKYQTAQSVLFIYWTADDYQQTGCYNLDCAAFVQTNPNWSLGGPLTTSATFGGSQAEFQLQWRLVRGNWWLYLQGDGALEPVGYYPSSIYGGGPLAHAATAILYGGEAVGYTSWPPMGSGGFAGLGFGGAAYQRAISYFDGKQKSHVALLKAYQPSPRCYTSIFKKKFGTLGASLFFGGPGGDDC